MRFLISVGCLVNKDARKHRWTCQGNHWTQSLSKGTHKHSWRDTAMRRRAGQSLTKGRIEIDEGQDRDWWIAIEDMDKIMLSTVPQILNDIVIKELKHINCLAVSVSMTNCQTFLFPTKKHVDYLAVWYGRCSSRNQCMTMLDTYTDTK